MLEPFRKLMITKKQRREIYDRSDRMCEAMVLGSNYIWTRCWASPIEIHHLLTRARGGNVLDRVDETYHLIALCRAHHLGADGQAAYDEGLLIEGRVMMNAKGNPVYQGPDIYLKEKYHE